MQLTCIVAAILSPALLVAADGPYFVTYSHRMEEPGNLEVAVHTVTGRPKEETRFYNTLFEFEYGVKAWWTAELYLSRDSARVENRFRPLMREHWINPVIYVEYADLNGADKSLREIVGHDSREVEAGARLKRKREIETKLILSSNFRGWNVSENFIAEKNLANEPWEFGYALGMNRPLAKAARPDRCRLCPENFSAGLELYGGLGTRYEFGLRGTSHYLAPTIAWTLPNNTVFKFSPSFGLTGESYRTLFRFTLAHEINQFPRLFRRR